MTRLVTWATYGSTMMAPAPGDVLTPYFVLHRCDTTRAVAYYCEPCRQPLANVAQLVIHIEEDGPGVEHHIAVHCPVCRLYEAPDPAQMRALFGSPADVRQGGAA